MGWPVGGAMRLKANLSSSAPVLAAGDADAFGDKLAGALLLPESCVRSSQIADGGGAVVLEVSGLDEREESQAMATLISGKAAATALALLGVDRVQVGDENDAALQHAKAAEGELVALREANEGLKGRLRLLMQQRCDQVRGRS